MKSSQYYNGISSKPNEVKITYTRGDNSLRLSVDFNELYWNLDDCELSKQDDTLFVYKNDSDEQIHVFDTYLISEIFENQEKNFFEKLYYKLVNSKFIVHIVLVSIVFIIILFVNNYIIPDIAENNTKLIPESFDIELGNDYIVDYLKENELDTTKTKLAQEFIDKMKIDSPFNYTVSVIKSEELNAFALPGGNIVVFSEIIHKMNSYRAFAALLSHEAAHVSNRHSVKKLNRDLSSYIFISIVLSDVNGVMAVLTENAAKLQSLSYSRKMEEEADSDGLQTLIDNKISPKGMMQLFESLESEETDSISEQHQNFEFLSTHPLMEHRIGFVQNYIDQNTFEVIENSDMEDVFSQLQSISD